MTHTANDIDIHRLIELEYINSDAGGNRWGRLHPDIPIKAYDTDRRLLGVHEVLIKLVNESECAQGHAECQEPYLAENGEDCNCQTCRRVWRNRPAARLHHFREDVIDAVNAAGVINADTDSSNAEVLKTIEKITQEHAQLAGEAESYRQALDRAKAELAEHRRATLTPLTGPAPRDLGAENADLVTRLRRQSDAIADLQDMRNGIADVLDDLDAKVSKRVNDDG